MEKNQNEKNSKWEIIGAPRGKKFKIYFFAGTCAWTPFGAGPWMPCDSAPREKKRKNEIFPFFPLFFPLFPHFFRTFFCFSKTRKNKSGKIEEKLGKVPI